MAKANIGLKVEGLEVARRVIRNISPKNNSDFVQAALVTSALLVQDNAAFHQIIRGGKDAPVKKRLTSRSGTGRRSIRVDRKKELFIEIGSDLIYMKNHETGGTFLVPAHNVRSHKRKNSLARRGKRIVTVKAHRRKSHNIKFPARPFLLPALDAVEGQFEGIFAAEWQKQIDKETNSARGIT
jgi:hypothetical protein